MKANGIGFKFILMLIVLAVSVSGLAFESPPSYVERADFIEVGILPQTVYLGHDVSFNTGSLDDSRILVKYWGSDSREFRDFGSSVTFKDGKRYHAWETTYDKTIPGYGGKNKVALLGPRSVEVPSKVCYQVLDLNPEPGERQYKFLVDSNPNGTLDAISAEYVVQKSGKLVDEGCFDVDGQTELWALVEDSSGSLISVEDIETYNPTPDPTVPTKTLVPPETVTPTPDPTVPTKTLVPPETVTPTPEPWIINLPQLFARYPEQPKSIPSADFIIKFAGRKGELVASPVRWDSVTGEWYISEVRGLDWASVEWNQDLPGYIIFNDTEFNILHTGKLTDFNEGTYRVVIGDLDNPVYVFRFTVLREVEEPEGYNPDQPEVEVVLRFLNGSLLP